MPRSLPTRPSLEHLRKEARHLLTAHRRGDATACEVLRCLRRFAGASDADMLAAEVSLQEMQHALAAHYGFRSWAMLRKFCAHVQPLAFSVREGRCEARHAEELRLRVTEVLGTSPAVQTGEQFLVRGQYELAPGSEVEGIMLGGMGRNRGMPSHLSPGAGRFELTTELLEAQAGREGHLDILMAGRPGTDPGTRLRIVLEPETPTPDTAG
jgi:hypothetical protein